MRTKLLILAAACTALAACQTTPEGGVTADRTNYKAIGTEPFWSLTLADGVMTFTDEGNDVKIRVTDYFARSTFNGWRYESKKMTADVTFAPCGDGMSEWTYKDTVTVKLGDQTYSGCGGGILPPETLEGTAWRVVSIDGAAIATEREARLNFDGKRMSGTIGCNRMGADYAFNKNAVSFGPLMSTKMGCPDPVGKQETIFANVLGAVASTSFPGDGTMVLTAKDGGKIVLMQLM